MSVRARHDGRTPGQLRPITMTTSYLRHAEGSCLVSFGETRVLCAASFSEGVPGWRRGTGAGWVTAEYNMLPRSGLERTPRSAQQGGRSTEIQRLVSRCLRGAVDLDALGENTIIVDCDVIEADGGTRTAAISGAMVALAEAMRTLRERRVLRRDPIVELVAAVSVGIVETVPVLDLDYAEDSKAETDMNLVMTESGRFVEIQGTAEGVAFSRRELGQLLTLGSRGIRRIVKKQRTTLARAAS